MNESEIIQGRPIGVEELAPVKGLLATQPDWSRWRVSVELAWMWNGRTPTGQLKDMAARTLLLKLEQRRWIELPPRRRASPNRMRHKQMPTLEPAVCEEPLHRPLSGLLPLIFAEVSTPSAPERALFEVLLHRHHYLSHRSPVGENLQYLVRGRGGVAMRGPGPPYRLGRSHASGASPSANEQHALLNPAVGAGPASGQLCFKPGYPPAQFGLAVQIWPSHLSAGDFRPTRPLRGHLLPSRQLAAGGPDQGANPPGLRRGQAPSGSPKRHLPLPLAPPLCRTLAGLKTTLHPLNQHL